MLKNYLTSALRFLKRNKLFAGINILGLSLALAASFIILLLVINELSYNNGFKNRKQIYRVLNVCSNFCFGCGSGFAHRTLSFVQNIED